MKPIELGGELGSRRARGSSSGPKARKDAGLPRKPGQAKLLLGLAGGWQAARHWAQAEEPGRPRPAGSAPLPGRPGRCAAQLGPCTQGCRSRPPCRPAAGSGGSAGPQGGRGSPHPLHMWPSRWKAAGQGVERGHRPPVLPFCLKSSITKTNCPPGRTKLPFHARV